MVQRTEGPFDYYQDIHNGVNGDTIRSDAEDPGLNADTIAALSGELEGDAQRVAGELSGDITSEVQTNPQEAARTSRDLAANGHYAVSLVNQFAGLVDDFDTTVNGLNQRFRSDVGATRRSQVMAISRDEGRTMDDLDMDGIKASVKASLQGEYDKAVSTLDDDADSIATKFDDGPTTANVREMIRQGLMPLSAAVLYPDLELTAADKRQHFRHLSPDQLRAYLNSEDDNESLLAELQVSEEEWAELVGQGTIHHPATTVRYFDFPADPGGGVVVLDWWIPEDSWAGPQR